MHNNDRTLWTEGMFLGPQHFQQHDRFLTHTISQLAQCCGPWPYGLIDYEYDEHALTEGQFVLTRLSGFFSDGTAFQCPEHSPLPVPLSVDQNCTNTVIHVALPFKNQQDKDVVEQPTQDSFARYILADRLVTDRHSPDANDEATVFTARLWVRLLTDSSEQNSAFLTIPVARIIEKREDGRLVLDEQFYPCAMHLNASVPLQKLLRELLSLIQQRATDLASRLGTVTASDTSQLNQLLLLQILNRHTPLIRHLCESPPTHPHQLYRDLCQLAGELSTITRASRLAPELTDYRHIEQYQSFVPVMDSLRESLNWIPDRVSEPFAVELVRPGLYSVKVRNTDLFNQARFILAARATIPPDQLSQRLPRQVTISEKTKLRGLVEAQTQGIVIKPTVRIPNSIPTYESYVYFDLSKDGLLWNEIAVSGDMAMHVAGNYSDLKMQLWAIQDD